MTTEEIIKRLENLQRLYPDSDYGMPTMSECNEGDYVPYCDIEELINELKQTK